MSIGNIGLILPAGLFCKSSVLCHSEIKLALIRSHFWCSDAYADGPGVLSELVQNADDAGATRVAFLLDERSYGTNSVLGAH